MHGAALERELRELAWKYATLRALRALRASAGREAPREALRELSRRCPGSLAELDRLEGALLDARAAETRRLVAEGAQAPLPTWARAWMHVHRALRGALAIKRRLGGARLVDHPLREAIVTGILASGTDEERALVGELDRIAAPPGGRLLDWVLARVGVELGIEGDLRELLMPRPPG